MLAIKKILVPTDLSLSAIAYAISLAKKHAAEVTVLHVLPNKAINESVAPAYITDDLIAPAGAARDAARPSNLDNIVERNQRRVHDFLHQKLGPDILKSVKINVLVRFGRTAKEVVAAAKEDHSEPNRDDDPPLWFDAPITWNLYRVDRWPFSVSSSVDSACG